MIRPTRYALATIAIAFGAQPAIAQDQAADPGFELHANDPNPFVASTTIPFTLGDPIFAADTPVTVTMRVFDLLGQPVAYPVAIDHPSGIVDLRALSYTTSGDYEAFWDGTNESGTALPAGAYVVELTVNDQQLLRRVRLTEPALN